MRLDEEKVAGLTATVVKVSPHSPGGSLYEVQTSSKVEHRRTLWLLDRQVGGKPPVVGEKVRLTWVEDGRRNSRWEVSSSSSSAGASGGDTGSRSPRRRPVGGGGPRGDSRRR